MTGKRGDEVALARGRRRGDGRDRGSGRIVVDGKVPLRTGTTIYSHMSCSFSNEQISCTTLAVHYHDTVRSDDLGPNFDHHNLFVNLRAECIPDL